MIIRCPRCEFSRTISLSKIPATAELATCPKCKYRFRFRTLSGDVDLAADQPENVHRETPAERDKPLEGRGEITRDIWDAVDALHLRWQKNLEEQVTEVVTPVPSSGERTRSADDQPVTPAASIAPLQEDGGITLPSEPVTASELMPNPPASQEEQGRSLDEAEQPEPSDQVGPSSSAPGLLAASAKPDYGLMPPEEWVERDIRMLHHSSDGPSRDLGRLREYEPTLDEDGEGAVPGQDITEPISAALRPGGSDQPIAWERLGDRNPLASFFQTLGESLTNRASFFSRLAPGSPILPSVVFFLVLGCLGVACTVFWTRIAVAVYPDIFNPGNLPARQVSLLVLSPPVLALLGFILAGCLRAFQQFLTGRRADFSLACKLVAYASSSFVLCLIPLIGPLLASIWFLVSLARGCRYTLALPWRQAAVLPILPGLFFLLGVYWVFIH